MVGGPIRQRGEPMSAGYRRIVLVRWREDLEEARLRTFLDWVREHFARVPFAGGFQGVALDGSGADWCYSVDFRTHEEMEAFRNHPFHQELARELVGPSGPGSDTSMIQESLAIYLTPDGDGSPRP